MTEEVAKYFCNICPFQTRTKGYLKMHVENKHKILHVSNVILNLKED